MQLSIDNINQQIAAWDKAIKEEAKRVENSGSEQHEEKRRQIEELKASFKDLGQQLESLHIEQRSLIADRDAAKKDGDEASNALKVAQNAISDSQSRLQGLQEQDRNRLAPYGNKMQEVLDQIGKMKWYGDRPVGPFGMHVKLKDARTWAPLFRAHLGGLMTSFAITDNRDRFVSHFFHWLKSNVSFSSQLKQLLMSTHNPQCQIIVSERDLFDFSQGEPPQGYQTILRAIEVRCSLTRHLVPQLIF